MKCINPMLGKEKDIESGYGDHTSTSLSASGVRKYNSTAGRFMSVDPLWEKYLSCSPYQYSGNNPVNAVDINGKEPLPKEDGINIRNAVLPPREQQVLAGCIGITGGIAGIMLSYGALTGPSVGAMSAGMLLLESAWFSGSLYATASGTVQTISALASNELAAEVAGSNPGFIAGMAIDGLAGNKNNEVANISSAIYSLSSIVFTIVPNTEGHKTYKGISALSDIFSSAPNPTFSFLLEQKNNGKDSALPGRNDVGKKKAPNNVIKFEMMGR